ncbi:MAG TPA: HNH endonuclease [Humisphaera sp.]
MSFTRRTAVELFADAVGSWHPRTRHALEVLRVAGLSGLGVLSASAMTLTERQIRKDLRALGKLTPGAADDRVAALPVTWADALAAAAAAHPADNSVYPILPPPGHVVGKPPCLKPARKGAWSSGCMRAAWGNIRPFGLATAEKPCPGCGRPLRYWCQGKQGEPGFRWAVDHVRAHAAGGCVCHFNLAALCPSCNIRKGKGKGGSTSGN